jgi:hypothetical protein
VAHDIKNTKKRTWVFFYFTAIVFKVALEMAAEMVLYSLLFLMKP